MEWQLHGAFVDFRRNSKLSYGMHYQLLVVLLAPSKLDQILLISTIRYCYFTPFPSSLTDPFTLTPPPLTCHCLSLTRTNNHVFRSKEVPSPIETTSYSSNKHPPISNPTQSTSPSHSANLPPNLGATTLTLNSPKNSNQK